MKQATIKVPSELFALAESSHFEGEYELPVLQAGPDDYRFEDSVKWSVDVTNTGSALLVMGHATGVGVCACSRCLEDVSLSFEGEIEGYFLLEGQDADDFEDDDAPGEDEFEVLPADHIIDLAPLINAALIIDADGMPLCKPDCAGLCPVCGANLNEGPCGCSRSKDLEEFDKAASPFAALANFRFED